MITGFLDINDLSARDFYNEIRREHESSAGNQTSFANVLLAAMDFNSFCQMMTGIRHNPEYEIVFCPPLVSIHDEFSTAESKNNYEDEEMNDGYKSSFKEEYDDNSYK